MLLTGTGWLHHLYHVECISSRPITVIKQPPARIVPVLVTTDQPRMEGNTPVVRRDISLYLKTM